SALSDDDAYMVERAADPLHYPGIDSKPFGNDPYTGPPRSRQGPRIRFSSGNWGASEAFTLAPGPRKASTDSFRNHRPLEFGKYAHHLKHRFACRRRGVEPLLAQE